ncbi:MAG: Hpt domain-containing protein [Sulfuricurvum sp.]|jgi:HPt (histidine-containing phosphotransfer) domain-containing protein
MMNEEQQIQEFEQRFSEIKTMLHLTDEIMIRLNNTFLETVALTLKQLEAAILEEDYEAIERYAHAIKGSSSSLRYTKISDIAEVLEKSAHAKKSDTYQEMLNDLNAELDAAQQCYFLWKNVKIKKEQDF